MFKRIVCLFNGHQWKYVNTKVWLENKIPKSEALYRKCKRCERMEWTS